MSTQPPDWQHPWLRVSLLIRGILVTQWDDQIRREVPKALALKARIQRAGWFN